MKEQKSGNYEGSTKIKTQNGYTKPPITNFDQGRITEHYRTLRDRQQKKLSQINMSEQNKKRLLGFSEGYYCTNTCDPSNLVSENHPLKGRTLMTKQAYSIHLLNKKKEKDIKSREGSCYNSISRIFSEGDVRLSSDIDKQFAYSIDKDVKWLDDESQKHLHSNKQKMKQQF